MPANPRAPLCAAPDKAPRPASFAIPALSCDAHMHICGPESRYSYVPERIYTPPDALLPAYLRVADTLGIERVVFVQPSIYGADNSAMLEAMRVCPLECRGVAVIGDHVTAETLRAWHTAGIRGARLNIVDTRDRHGTLPIEAIRALAEQIAPLGWHLELLLHVDGFPTLESALADLPVDLVFGHLGYLSRGRGASDPGFRALLRLLERGRSWVKLTGPYRLTDAPFPYEPVTELAAALLRTAPQRLVWGSDWPHVMLRGTMPNDGGLLDLLCEWIPDPHSRHTVLVDNPARLYDF